MSQRDSHQPASRSAILPLTTLLQQSWACRSRGRLVKHLPLLSCCITSDDWGGMQKLTGTNYVWEAGRQARIKVSKCWGGKRNLMPYARVLQWMCVRSWVPACSQFIITIIIQDVSVHTRAISHEAWSLKEYIVLYTSALAEQFTTHSFIRGGCCPHRSHYQSSQAAARVNLPGEDSQHLCFDGFSLWV